ncbi:sodium:solute symporter family protein [Enhygromyxa salina]|uniref:Sodium/glucose cotransporter n=1 Tax=Enhygromyxa salina TaxID=215803 RepID=A0A2S9Y891_9BACT|nr:sodium:solute symporter family protein [Enhygromyxa salina]PRQ01236.1 Sodium/glucose cotransporter [Enhygromyxa salina]
MSAQLSTILAITVIAYAALMLGIGWWARGRVESTEDFLVAGRKLPLSLATPTLLATWFGAGTLLTATDEVRAGGLRMAALEPIGAGLCLILAGLLLAPKLWRMKLLTLGDFYRNRFGVRAERLSAALMVPSYFGWIAAQYVALAHMLEISFGLPLTLGLVLVAAIGIAYTLLGGMWSVTATDAIQIALVILGLLALAWVVLRELGGPLIGLERIWTAMPADKRVVIPHAQAGELLGWLGVLAVGSLGNLPGQELAQRMFAARDERTAVWACHLSGLGYLSIGMLPLIVGLAADLLVPGAPERSTLTTLAQLFLSPGMAVVFTLVLMSAVLSTIDSAILSPSSVLAQNLAWPLLGAELEPRGWTPLRMNRLCVVVIGLGALVTAFVGEDAYSLLEEAYALGLVSLLVPLLVGLHSERGRERAALVAMVVGTGSWVLHLVSGAESFMGSWWPAGWVPLPVGLCCAGLAGAGYVITAQLELG